MYTHCCHNRVLTSAAQIPFQGSALKAHNTPYTDGSTLHLSISVMSMTICHLVVIPSQEYRILQIQIRSKVWGTWWTANDWSKIDARVSGHVSSQPNASQFLRVVRLGNYVTKKLFTVPLGKFNFTLYLHFRNRQCPPPNKCVSKPCLARSSGHWALCCSCVGLCSGVPCIELLPVGISHHQMEVSALSGAKSALIRNIGLAST